MSSVDITFTKYTGHGNSFIILDELQESVVRENSKGEMAQRLLDSSFGIGADNVIYLQPASLPTMNEIAQDKPYWGADYAGRFSAEWSHANVVFRLFEPEGSEALICGNGMRCASSFIHRQYGRPSTLFLTEVPSTDPIVLRGESKSTRAHGQTAESAKVEIGVIRPVPPEFAPQGSVHDSHRADPIQVASAPSITSRPSPARAYMLHTGEPYLVILDEGDETNWKFGSWFTELGHAINDQSTRFPLGMNVVSCRRTSGASLQFRVFERLKNRETWASGSGAVAAVAVSRATGYVSTTEVTEVWSVSSYASEAGPICVTKGPDSRWSIEGSVELICSGSIPNRRPWADWRHLEAVAPGGSR
jgi:diaminopimelate epimerase